MPFVFIVLGIGLLIVAIRGTQATAATLLKSEFSGAGSFLPWVISIAILCAVGFIKPVRPIADAMVGLIIMVMLIGSDKSFFAQFNQQIRNPVAAPLPPAGAAPSYVPQQTILPNGGTGYQYGPNYQPAPTVPGVPTNDPYLPTFQPPTA